MKYRLIWPVALVLAIQLLALFCVAPCLYCIEPLKEVPLLIARQPLVPVGNGRIRLLVLSYDLIPDNAMPVVVVALDHEVAYFKGTTLEPLARRVYPANEWVLISPNGQYIAVSSETKNASEKVAYENLWVEDWRGRRLWSMGAVMNCVYEPTSTGGLVEHPTSSPAIEEWTGPRGFKVVPPPSRHGLRIYDATGKLLLEGVDPSETGLQRKGWVSRDGKYLAFAYAWVSPEKRRSEPLLGDKGCLVVYDLEKGVELWRRHFDGRSPEYLALSGEADRVMCLAPPAGAVREDAEPTTLYLFDLSGKEIAQRALTLAGSRFRTEGMVVSDDGKLCAFVANKASAFVIRMEDGSTVWQFERPQTVGGMYCVGVANDGSVLLATRSREPGDHPEGLMVIEKDGQEVRTLESDRFKLPGHATAWAMSPDGKSVWVLNGSTLALYSLDDKSSQEGGGAQ